MPFTSPIFGYHAQPIHGPLRPHQLPDARSSDVKGRTLLRRIRSGYTVISPLRTNKSGSQHLPSPPPEPAVEEIESPFSSPDDEEQSQPQLQSDSRRPPTPPAYQALDPPRYVDQTLPPALPGYTALPLPVEPEEDEPVRDLKVPEAQAQLRKRYRDALRRRLASTKNFLSGDRWSAAGSDTESIRTDDDASEAGVVLYRDGDQWLGSTMRPQGGGRVKKDFEVVPRQKGFKGWVKRMWRGLTDFLDEHPYLYILAIFVIVVVVLCLLI